MGKTDPDYVATKCACGWYNVLPRISLANNEAQHPDPTDTKQRYGHHVFPGQDNDYICYGPLTALDPAVDLVVAAPLVDAFKINSVRILQDTFAADLAAGKVPDPVGVKP